MPETTVAEPKMRSKLCTEEERKNTRRLEKAGNHEVQDRSGERK
jgi:hypothetical protein